MDNTPNGLISQELDDLTMTQAFTCHPENCTSYLNNKEISNILMTLNIRSIYKNIDQFQIFLHRSKLEPLLIILTECWLQSHIQPPALHNYNTYLTTNLRNKNDGVVVYVRDCIDCLCEEPSFRDGTCLLIKYKDSAIISIYRSPSIRNITNFLSSLEDLINKMTTFKNIYIVGDININIRPTNTDSNSSFYLDMLYGLGFLPAHTLCTRENKCLDHIFVKTECMGTCLVINTFITDHKVVLLGMNDIPKPKPERTVKRINYDKAIEHLINTDLKSILNNSDPNQAAESLTNAIINSIHINTNILSVSRNQRILKPWITVGLLRCIRNRDQMHLKLRKFPNNDVLKITYTRYRNYCGSIIKKLKNTYERTELEKAGNNTKLMWQKIKDITNTKNKRTPSSELINTYDPKKSLDNVNEFFSSVGKNLAQAIENTHGQSTKQLPSSTLNSLVLLEATEEEIDSIIINLKNSSACGWDEIPTTFVKKARHIIIPYLAKIYNLCLSEGVFPDVFKKSLIHPIHKNGNRKDVNNYRPISVLPVLSKILEKLLNNRLVNFLEKHHIISSFQFGFRKGKSTEDAVNYLINTVTKQIDSREKVIGVFLDLKKAFDTVSVPILLEKMERYGIRGIPLEMFKSYLSHRFQRVKILNYVSNDSPVYFGVPQGSVLGPSLFLIYINDLCNMALTNGSVISFADDTALVFHGRTWSEAHLNAERGLETVSMWLNTNLLTLNIEKTNYMTFTITKSTKPPESFKLLLHNCHRTLSSTHCTCLEIRKTEEIKYLGVIIDDLCKWDLHVGLLTGRVRKLSWIFKKLRHIADSRLITIVYKALCQSVTQYCISIWGGTHKTTLMPLERAQRCVLKVMSFRPYRYPTRLLYTECKLLTVRQIYILQVILKKHKITPYDRNLPPKRRNYQICSNSQPRTAYIKQQFTYMSNYLYNKINKQLRIHEITYSECKFKMTNWLLTLDYDQTEDFLLFVR